MKNVLVVKSSVNGEAGQSSQLVNQFLSVLAQKSEINQTSIDLNEMSLPHLSGEETAAWFVQPADRNEQQAALAAISDQQIANVEAADIIILGVPMYNFGIPSTLKSWLDRIARAGITFRYTDQGPVGLLKNKRVFVMAARGGFYAGTSADTQTPYLKNFFNFLGLSDVDFVFAEGLNTGKEAAETSWQEANKKIIELIANAFA